MKTGRQRESRRYTWEMVKAVAVRTDTTIVRIRVLPNEQPTPICSIRERPGAQFCYLETCDEAVDRVCVGLALQSQGHCEGSALLSRRAFANCAVFRLGGFI